MATIQDRIEIAAPVEAVFDFVADYRNALEWMAGFERFHPVGSVTRGIGAAVRASGRVMGMPVETTLRIVEFEENERIVSVSETPVSSRSVWRFSPTATGTLVEFVGEYDFPGANVPFIANRVVQELKAMTRQTLENLRRRCEARSGGA